MMNKNFDEQFSAFVDGEVAFDSKLCTQIQQDQELRQRWHRYHVISDAMKGHLEDASFPDISDRLVTALEQEPTILAPKRHVFHTRQWKKQVAGLAVAASVATAAVITVQQTRYTANGDLQTAQTTTINQPVASVNYTQQAANSQNRLNSEVESKLSGYLVQHNEYSMSSKMQGALPYMRIVSVTRGSRITKQEDE